MKNIITFLLLYTGTIICASTPQAIPSDTPGGQPPAKRQLSAKSIAKIQLHLPKVSLDDLNRALVKAVQANNTLRVKALLQNGADANQTINVPHRIFEDEDTIRLIPIPFPLLHYTAYKNFTGLIPLLATTQTIRQQSKNKRTALIVAAYYGRTEPCQALLLQDPAKQTVDVYDIDGKTALYHAIERTSIDNKMDIETEPSNATRQDYDLILHYLLDAGANPDATDPTLARRPLEIASFKGNFVAVEALLKAKANVNARGHAGLSALDHAAIKGNKKVVEILLKAGADKNATDRYGKRPVDWARDFEHDSLIRLLK